MAFRGGKISHTITVSLPIACKHIQRFRVWGVRVLENGLHIHSRQKNLIKNFTAIIPLLYMKLRCYFPHNILLHMPGNSTTQSSFRASQTSRDEYVTLNSHTMCVMT